MENTMQLQPTRSLSRLQLGLVIITGIGLIQSSIIGGLNFSIADLTLVLLMFAMMSRQDATIPVIEMTFLGIIFVSRTVISLILPTWQTILNPEIFDSVLKFGLIVVYFLTGYLIGGHREAIQTLVKGFVLANLVIGIVGIVVVTCHLNSLVPFMFSAYRFRGLMNDPNYFSMLQLMCIPFVGALWHHRPTLRLVLTTCFAVAAILSGSKSAMIVLCLYGGGVLVVKCWRALVAGRFSRLVVGMMLIAAAVLVGILLLPQITGLIHTLAVSNPSFERVATLFSGDNPLSDNGSGRTDAWYHALEITTLTSGLGIGFHNYAVVAGQLIGDPVIAHNTILQLLVEWGLGLTFIFVSYVGIQLVRSLGNPDRMARATTGAFLICLAFSMSISLNNSRIFWLFLALWLTQRGRT